MQNFGLSMPELIDVLNENGVKTGRVVSRDEVHREGLWHRIAVVAVIDNEHHILLQQRSMNKLTNPGRWDITAVGHVDAGENSYATALRETAEEIGIKVGGGGCTLSQAIQELRATTGKASKWLTGKFTIALSPKFQKLPSKI